jgi:hypothetical protein
LSTADLSGVAGGGQPDRQYTEVDVVVVVVVPPADDDEAFGRKTSSAVIPIATKTTIATASAEIASLG